MYVRRHSGHFSHKVMGDYPNASAAAADGALVLRQDLSLCRTW